MGQMHSDKLWCRKNEVEKTLRYLEMERREVERNTKWIDQATYESRVDLLDRLTKWYREELGQIEEAFSKESRYGLCFACHEPIEADRLEICPEAEFCSDCQGYRETLNAAAL
jgi:RNA polymerase-binding transcription factor DksA